MNSKGNSLIQVMIAGAITLIIALAVASLLMNQNKEVKAIQEKLLTQEINSQIKNTLLNSEYCSCLFRNRTFDTSVKVWTPAISNLPQAYVSVPSLPLACTPDTLNLVPNVGSVISGSQLQIQSLTVVDSVEVIPGSGSYTANLEVGFDQTVRALKKIKTPIVFSVNTALGTAATRPFINCMAANSTQQLSILKPGSGHDGMTGIAACASIGKVCQYVHSLNTIWNDVGCPGATHCMRVCMTWYNMSLPGIPNSYGQLANDPVNGGLTNIHSCAAQIGRMKTYLHSGVVECGGFFSAVCL
jgi:type II secretory pathway pseudopilin PulG